MYINTCTYDMQYLICVDNTTNESNKLLIDHWSEISLKKYATKKMDINNARINKSLLKIFIHIWLNLTLSTYNSDSTTSKEDTW